MSDISSGEAYLKIPLPLGSGDPVLGVGFGDDSGNKVGAEYNDGTENGSTYVQHQGGDDTLRIGVDQTGLNAKGLKGSE